VQDRSGDKDRDVGKTGRHHGGDRPTREVFEDHLRLRLAGKLEEDLQRNYAPDVVLLTSNSNARGHDALRMSARRLSQQLPGARFEIVSKQVDGRFALLIWKATSDRFDALAGADSFVVEDGLIRLQTIHYRLVGEAQGAQRR
jgi:hypothetical protein